MTQDIPATDFIARLNAERDALKSLVALLETEQQALIYGHTEQLLDLSAKKTQAVHELSRLADMRRNTLLAHSAEIKASSITAWLQSYAAGSLPIWQDIQKLVEQMQYLNRANGVLIQSKMRYSQQALTVLHNAANSVHGLYGADGQAHFPSSGRVLGSV